MSKQKVIIKGPNADPSPGKPVIRDFSPRVRFSSGMAGEAHELTIPVEQWRKQATKKKVYYYIYYIF